MAEVAHVVGVFLAGLGLVLLVSLFVQAPLMPLVKGWSNRTSPDE